MSFPGFDILRCDSTIDSGDLKSVEDVLVNAAPDGLLWSRNVSRAAKVSENFAFGILSRLVEQQKFEMHQAIRCSGCNGIAIVGDGIEETSGECDSCGEFQEEFETIKVFRPTKTLGDFLAREGEEIRKQPSSKLVLVIHGIRTWAEWITTLEHEMSDCPEVVVKSIGYGKFDALQFLCPVYFRDRAVKIAKTKLRNAIQNFPNREIIVIAHSFGTHVLTQAMRDGDIRPERILLCGSVLPANFNWDTLPGCPNVETETGTERVVNDCGDLDWWPVMAKFATVGFGVGGTSGFQSSRVKDRHHRLGHSDYLVTAKPAKCWQWHKKKVLKDVPKEHLISGRKFMQTFWRPFILHGEIVSPEFTKSREASPVTMGLLEIFRLRNLAWIFVLLGVVYWAFGDGITGWANSTR